MPDEQKGHREPDALASTKSGCSSDATDDPSVRAGADDGEGKSTVETQRSRAGNPPPASYQHSSDPARLVDYWLSDAPLNASREFIETVAAADAKELAWQVRNLEEQFDAMREALIAFAFAQEYDANGNEYFVHGKRTREMAESVLASVGAYPAKEPS